MVLAGEADISQFLDSDQCTQMKDKEVTGCVSAASVETFTRFDTPSLILGDQRIREAVLHSLNVPAILLVIIGDTAMQVAQIVVLASKGFGPDLQPVAHDPKAATALVNAARDDGVPVESTELFINVRQTAKPRIAEIAQVFCPHRSGL